MAKKNIGGRAKRIEMTLEELAQKVDHAYELGVAQGRDSEQKVRRLSAEPECPMCKLKREADELRRRVAAQPTRRGTWGLADSQASK